MFKKLCLLAVICTFCLVALGAFVRLSDAGLGCPDWPGCYGHATPTHALHEIDAAQLMHPQGPVSAGKAWKEMLHRYLAGALCMLVAMLLIMAIVRAYRRPPGGNYLDRFPTVLLLVVGVIGIQVAFGAWTVTMKLRPAIVTGHLVLGLTTLSLLVCLWLRERAPLPVPATRTLRTAALVGLLIVIGQIMLGGWVSTNYAALACGDFPTCQGELIPAMDFSRAFHIVRELGYGADGNGLTMLDLTAIHWLHRLGALLTFCYIATLAFMLRTRHVLPQLALGIVVMLLIQVALGIGNVVLSLPLPIAVLHNAGAAMLLSLLVALNYRLNVRR